MYHIYYKSSGEIRMISLEKADDAIIQINFGDDILHMAYDGELDPMFEKYVIENGEVKKIDKDRTGEYKDNLINTDFKVTRHLEQKEQGIDTSLTDAEYESLLVQRQEWRDLIQ
jgi:hypothetical protein